MDPLSTLLSILKPHTFVAGGFDLNGDWSIHFDAHSGIKCWAVISGSCTLSVEGGDDEIWLSAGDCVLLPSGKRYCLANDLSLQPTAFKALQMVEWHSGMATLNGGGETMILGGHFAFTGAQADMLLSAMPRIVQVRDDSDKASLRWALERMRQELTDLQPGSSLVVQHLSQLMLVQALRLYLSDQAGPRVGWLAGLTHPQLAAAIGAIHADPGGRWTLAALARTAGMSRSSFAKQFKATVGTSPIEYLTQWRMVLAGNHLMEGSQPMSTIALSLGYESEAAFSTAFRRVTGCSPRQHRQAAKAGTALEIWQPATYSEVATG